MKRLILASILLFFASVGQLEAMCCFCDLPKCRHQVELGPEFYHVKRTRKGGTSQHGWLNGVRGRYDYIARYHFYFGLEGAYAKGNLHGASGDEAKLKSHFSDLSVEGRFGYTLQSKTGCCAQLIPFIGYGYFVERNDYTKPSPMPLHFKNTYNYTALGIIARAFVTPNLILGFDLTTKFSIDGKVKVTHDPEFDEQRLQYENKVHCRIAAPIYYRFCVWGRPAEFCLSPFYEYKHYGHHYNVPFDFLDTKIKNCGFDLFYVLRF